MHSRLFPPPAISTTAIKKWLKSMIIERAKENLVSYPVMPRGQKHQSLNRLFWRGSWTLKIISEITERASSYCHAWSSESGWWIGASNALLPTGWIQLPAKTPNEPLQLNRFIHAKCEQGACGTVGSSQTWALCATSAAFIQLTKQKTTPAPIMAKSFPLTRSRLDRAEWAGLRQTDSGAHLYPLINA